MPIPAGVEYRIYSNGGSGGPVNFTSPVATVTGATSWTGSALAHSTDTTFCIRAYNTSTGLEDLNLDRLVRVVIDGSGNIITNRPAAPFNLSARPTGTTSLIVQFAHHPINQPPPTSFNVWATAGGSVNYSATPNATVSYPAGGGLLKLLSATVTGLTAGTAYSIGVRAVNASGAETNTIAVSASTAASAPSSVTGLAASAQVQPTLNPRAIPGTA